MNKENKIIKSLWIGSSLSLLEQLSIKSFLSNGHSVHLYVYDNIKNIPDGVIVWDAHDVVKKDEIFQGQRRPGHYIGYEAFSDYFRYILLYNYGGWWSDLDVICLKPFDFQEEYVFASHVKQQKNSEVVPSGCIMKLPCQSKEAGYCIDACREIRDKTSIVYSAIGPRLVNKVIDLYDLKRFVREPEVFCPINWWEINKLVLPNEDFQITGNMYGIHCFNVRWGEDGLSKNSTYDECSVFEQLKAYYHVNT
ncbi:MAG: hypothetical protein JXJ04_02435 [Spirochaetales bacterium]|nr:hypothetical protein [Spirochaetales bacterium]